MDHKLNLLDLPIDILELILRPLLTAPSGGVICLCPCRVSSINPIPIFLIHPSIYTIACPLFYGVSNTFLLDLTASHGKKHTLGYLEDAAEERADVQRRTGREQDPLDQSGGKFLLLSREARGMVHRLEVRFDRLRGWIWDAFGVFLEDMALKGELADLCLTLCYDRSQELKTRRPSRDLGNDNSGGDNADGSFTTPASWAIYKRPPLVGLLALLADPGLRIARLRVTPVHDTAWCAFHAMRGGGSLVDGDQDEEAAMVEIDWRGVLKAVDPEGRRRAVI